MQDARAPMRTDFRHHRRSMPDEYLAMDINRAT